MLGVKSGSRQPGAGSPPWHKDPNKRIIYWRRKEEEEWTDEGRREHRGEAFGSGVSENAGHMSTFTANV